MNIFALTFALIIVSVLGSQSTIMGKNDCKGHMIIINEVQTKRPDWVELYNPNDYKVDLGGYRVYDRDEYEIAFAFPPKTIISPKGYLAKVVHKNTTGFAIEKNGETIFLWDACGNKIGTLNIPYIPKGSSYGLDANGNYKMLYPTRGKANY